MSDTASPPEIAAAIFNVFGIICSGLMLFHTIRRLRAVRTRGDPFMRHRMTLAGWRHIRCEIRLIAYHVGSLMLGGWAMLLPSGDSWYGYSSMMLRFILGAIFTILSIVDLRTDDAMWINLSRRRVGGQ